MGDGLGFGAIGAAEDPDQAWIADRQEIIGAGYADEPGDGDCAGRLAAAEPAAVERQHRGDIGAGRVAHEENAARSPPWSAILARVQRIAARHPR